MFTPGQRYSRRKDLHGQYKGQMQGGISTPANHPIILLFTGEQGTQYGYDDGFQPDGTFQYSGEGRIGDMRMRGGNLAVRDHASNGKTLHLFEYVETGVVQYIGEFSYAGHKTKRRPDQKGNSRDAILFDLAQETGAGTGVVPRPPKQKARGTPTSLKKKSLADLRKLALSGVGPNATPKQRKVNVQKRSAAVREYVLRRANGHCEGCGSPAPFMRKDGTPYVEPHHIVRRADHGPDHPRWVVALCPNCHRRVHSGADGHQYNKTLASLVGQLEGP